MLMSPDSGHVASTTEGKSESMLQVLWIIGAGSDWFIQFRGTQLQNDPGIHLKKGKIKKAEKL